MAVPSYISDRLRELAQKERTVRLLWGSARVAGCIIGFLLFAFLLDWWIDLYRDTPLLLRLLFWVTSIGGTIYLIRRWVIQPMNTGLEEDDVALWVEQSEDQFDYSLISAVQLNREQNRSEGMSGHLISAMTKQAEERSQGYTFEKLVDKRRLRWAMAAVLPPLLLLLLLWLIAPATMSALLARFGFAAVPIPRRTQLAKQSLPIQPQGEPVQLQFQVTGKWAENDQGTVRVVSKTTRSETYPLQYQSTATSGVGIFSAMIPAGSSTFDYDAWLNDGRTYESGHVDYAARPTIRTWMTKLVLPEYAGKRKDGTPYELDAPQGDLVAIAGSQGRVMAEADQKVEAAEVEFFGPILSDVAAALTPESGCLSLAFLQQARNYGLLSQGAGPVLSLGKVPLKLAEDGKTVTGNFIIPPHASAYRILVTNKHGFVNRPAPHRSIRWLPDRSPSVTLLPELYAGNPNPDLDVDGMPVPMEKSFRIAYQVKDDLTLDHAEMIYRINNGEWKSLPLQLKEAAANDTFDLSRGSFGQSKLSDQVEFHAIPSAKEDLLGKQLGGGRFDFQTRALKQLKLGDFIEYYIAVYDRHPDPDRPPGRSVVRRKQMVSNEQFLEWMITTLQQEGRLRQLERQQRRVFEDR